MRKKEVINPRSREKRGDVPFKTIAEMGNDGILVCDVKDQIVFANQAFAKIFKLSIKDILELPYHKLIDHRPQQNIYKKIVIKDHCIKGIILVGKIANAGLLLSLIQKKKDVSAYEHELLSDQFNFAKLIHYEGDKVLEIY